MRISMAFLSPEILPVISSITVLSEEPQTERSSPVLSLLLPVELLQQLDATVRELRWMGISAEELCRRIEGGCDHGND